MKDPMRLLETAASESELRILRAGAIEEPPPEAMQRLAARLGVRSSGAASATANPAADAAPAVQPDAGSTAVHAAGTKLTWSAIVLIAAGLTLAGGLWFANRPDADRSPQHTGSVPPATPAGSPPTAAGTTLPPTAARATIDPPLAPSAEISDPLDARALADEISRLDTVRRLLAANRSKPALAALRGYAVEHPRGALRQEAALLRIEAFERDGDRARARALAERFLADNPDSPHAPRVRALAIDGPDSRNSAAPDAR
jgi:hypothetical protein